MINTMAMPCDGCGQTASAEHIARRLQRLEWTTRYRPVHINTLLLGAFSPQEERDFLYAPGGGEGFSVCGGRRVQGGSGAAARCAEDRDGGKSGGRGACGVSTSGFFSDPRAGMPARQGCRTGGRGRGAAGKAPPAGGYKDSPVAETEASGADFASTGAG